MITLCSVIYIFYSGKNDCYGITFRIESRRWIHSTEEGVRSDDQELEPMCNLGGPFEHFIRDGPG